MRTLFSSDINTEPYGSKDMSYTQSDCAGMRTVEAKNTGAKSRGPIGFWVKSFGFGTAGRLSLNKWAPHVSNEQKLHKEY